MSCKPCLHTRSIAQRTVEQHDSDSLRAFLTRCQPEDATLAGFEHSVRAWAWGSEYVHLSDEQYGKLT
jgi:hypothetical protein